MIRLDAQWLVLRAEWSAPLRAGGHLPMASTFLVHDDGSHLRICVYLNHAGLPLSTGSPDA
ncbi:MAG: hypothetical protein ACXVX0_15815 [Blastococcus sp.]